VLALKADTTVRAWGSDIYGQCDVPSGLSNVVAVLASWNYSLALRRDGTTVAWGADDAGQAEVPSGLNGVTALSGNMEYCLALKNDGTVVSWGKAPNQPDGLINIKAIAAGQDYCLGLTADGTLVAWGANNSGQTNTPTDIGKVSALGAGWNYSVALMPNSVAPAGFSVLNSIWQAGSFSMLISGQTNRTYLLQFKQALTDRSWTDLAGVGGSSKPITLLDPEATNAHRFYRVREQ
jgi:alpha-tubulin suppressor-like RCC1 family protein